MQRMQQTSLVRFCDECGFANELHASECASCHSPLASTNASSVDDAPVVAPVTIAPKPVLEVTPGSLATTGMQSVPREFKPGMLLNGRYQIQKEIGSGGFSTVYLALDLQQNKREVAIKRIQISALTPRQVIDATETFNREVTMLARFAGTKGIPHFYEHLTDPENWYLVMEHVKGQTLEEYLQKQRGEYLNESEVRQIGFKLAQIMQELHHATPSVVFRDLKPANIMILPNHDLYLIDFGVARNFTFGKTRDTTPLGSPGYASPEQYGKAQTDRRSDIYSLGATLQTLLTGRDPLDLRAGEASLNPKAPSPAFRKLLDQMLDPDPIQRPVDMLDVQTRLVVKAVRPPSLLAYLLGSVRGTMLGLGVAALVILGSIVFMGLVTFLFLVLGNLGVTMGLGPLFFGLLILVLVALLGLWPIWVKLMMRITLWFFRRGRR